jgi:DNA modification methylase
MSKDKFSLHLGDCLESLRAMPDNSVDSIVTDPPYGLSFMGKKWDYDVPGVNVWAECLRVLKPGGHLLAFAGTRTQHRMAVRIEDAGFEIRDMIAWVYGSGFPKSLDVSKAIDKAAGAEREVVQQGERSAARPVVEDQSGGKAYRLAGDASITAPATDAARQWQGWGTALKPALEPITVARKPLSEKTIAANVLLHGTGGINIDGCRVGNETIKSHHTAMLAHGGQNTRPWHNGHEVTTSEHSGRWPANFIHDGSDEVVSLFPVTKSGAMKREVGGYEGESTTGFIRGKSGPSNQHGDSGSAARFFYCAKASRKDRHEGLDDPGAQFKHGTTLRQVENTATAGNHHPTVKPTDLMAYLVRLVTPPGGVVLDPFMGSGSTGKAAMREGFRFIGCELSAEYLAIARARIEHELSKLAANDNATQAAQRLVRQLQENDLFDPAVLQERSH